MEKRLTKEVHIGNRVIGGKNPILIQSMTNTKTEDVEATVAQIKKLTKAGCDIIRCAVPTMEAAQAIKEIKKIVEAGDYDIVHCHTPIAAACLVSGSLESSSSSILLQRL